MFYLADNEQQALGYANNPNHKRQYRHKDTNSLQLTIDTSISKTFTITKLNKKTAPIDININWGDGSVTTYDDLLDSEASNITHTYIDNNTYRITMFGSLIESPQSVIFQNNINLISVEGSIFIYLFRPGWSSLNSFFKGCTNLITISNDLFKLCLNIENFHECFSGCTSLQSIPEDLFDENVNIDSVHNCFQNCTSLQNIPINLFDNNIDITHFVSCFNGCSNITSAVPNLWNTAKWSKVTNSSQCFAGCIKAANYASIPAAWK